jgi:hypothetical protein
LSKTLPAPPQRTAGARDRRAQQVEAGAAAFRARRLEEDEMVPNVWDGVRTTTRRFHQAEV